MPGLLEEVGRGVGICRQGASRCCLVLLVPLNLGKGNTSIKNTHWPKAIAQECYTKSTSIRVESSGLTASLATTFLNFGIQAFHKRQTEVPSQIPDGDRAPDKMGRRVILHIVCYRTAHSHLSSL